MLHPPRGGAKLHGVSVGVICAIPEEITHLQAVLADPKADTVAGTEYLSGVLDGHRVILAGSGVGKVNAALTTTVLAERFGCRAVVFSGVAGGLSPELAVGDVVIADRVIQHDAGVYQDGRLQTYQAGHIPFFNPADGLGFPVPPDLLARVRERLTGFELPALPAAAGGGDRPARIAYGTVLSGDQYVHCEQTRERLFRDLGGLAVEMEGGAVAQVAASYSMSWLVIRALSDLAGRDSRFDFLAFVETVAASSAAIVRRLLPVL